MNTKSASDRPLRSRHLATHYLKIISLITEVGLKNMQLFFHDESKKNVKDGVF